MAESVAVLSYIVESTITCDLPGEEPIFDPRTVESTFRTLKREFGFVLVVWSPATPDLVREFHWNTEAERLRDRNGVGRSVERKATDREKREGQRQHEEAVV